LARFRNPFNLSLLCQIIESNVAQDQISTVRRQLDLLDLYWRYRVEGLDSEDAANDPDGQEFAAKAAVDLMVERRQLHVRRSDLAAVVGVHTPAIEFLLRHGALLETEAEPRARRNVGFAHNILFDYAVCRLWMDGLSDEAISRLGDPQNRDLLLAIRASICMAFEELWHCDPTRAQYWGRARAFVSNSGIRLIGKIITGDVAAAQYRTPSDCRWTLDNLSGDEAARQLLEYTIQAAVTRHTADPAAFPMVGDVTERNWMGLAAELITHIDRAAWAIKNLLAEFNRSNRQPTDQQFSDANQAARVLIEHGLSNSDSSRLVRPAIETATKTIVAAPPETIAALRPLLSQENFDRGGHEWLHQLTQRIGILAEHDADFALELVEKAFTVAGDRDKHIPMGGRILGVQFNEADMLRMGQHDICNAFPAIMEQNPDVGTRIYLKVMQLTVERRHGEITQHTTTVQFPFRDKQAHFREDGSYVWMQGAGGGYDNWFKVQEAFVAGIRKIADAGDEAAVSGILDRIVEEAEYAVVWNTVLRAGAGAPRTLGPLIAELLYSSVILGEFDTRTAAGNLLASGFEYFSHEQRGRIEQAILDLPENTPEEHREFAEMRRDRALGCIPAEMIQSELLRNRLAELEEQGGPPPNVPDFSITMSCGPQEEHWHLRRQGVEIEKAENVPLIEAAKALRVIPDPQGSNTIGAAEVASYLPVLERADAAIEAGRTAGADDAMLSELEADLTAACAKLARPDGLSGDAPVVQFMRRVLLRSSRSSRPEHTSDEDAQWDRGHVYWGAPSTRIDAALGLMLLAGRAETVDTEILEAIERLAKDDVNAVRLQILSNLGWLAYTANDLFWRLVEGCCRDEPRGAILSFFVSGVILRSPKSDFERFRPLVDQLYARTCDGSPKEELMHGCATFYFRGALWYQDDHCERFIATVADAPTDRPSEASQIVRLCRDFLRWQDASMLAEENSRVRKWAFELLSRVTGSLKERKSALLQARREQQRDAWPEEDINSLRQVHMMIDHVATELYFGSGAFDSKKLNDGAEGEAAPPSVEDKRRMLTEGAELLDALIDGAFVEAAYRVLETLEFLVDADPVGVIQRIAALVRTAKKDDLHYEGMAADLIVRIVERYLSEYQNFLMKDCGALDALLDILDAFVAPGWPQATRLTYRLGEVFR